MRYIYYLLTVLIIITLSIVGILLKTNNSNINSNEIALKVNGRTFSNDEFRSLINDKPHDLTDFQFTRIIIEKELLVQEAMRQKIHEESDFKKNIKNFYEQSLITALMNWKNKEFNPIVTDEEISKFFNRMNNQVEMTIYSYKDFDSAKKGSYHINEKNIKINFSDLSDTLKYYLSEIDPGQTTPPLQDEYAYQVIKLNKIDNSSINTPINSTMRSFAKKIIEDGKKKALMENWQQEIKNKAMIDIKEYK